MKIRHGFVSNSSSTSFECQICGHTESGYDSVGIEDFGFKRCVNGHIICTDHEKRDALPDGYDPYEIPEECCPICQYEEPSNANLRSYFLVTTDITIDMVMAEIKKVNKRRRKVYDLEYVEHVMKEKNMNMDDLLASLKAKFPKYEDFLTHINELWHENKNRICQ